MGEQLTVTAAVISSVVAVVAIVIQQLSARTQQSIQAQQDITAKYAAMMEYRKQYPWVLSIAPLWSSDSFRKVYEPHSEDDERYAIYYGYIELFTFYATAVLYAQQRRYLDRKLFEKQHEPLVRLVLAEHYPILSKIIRPDGFVCRYLVDHVQRIWTTEQWEAEYRKLVFGEQPNSPITQATVA